MSKDNIAYITGTSSGIGKALAGQLLAKGWQVVGIARRNTIEHTCYTHVIANLAGPAANWQPSVFKNHAPNAKVVLVNNAGTLGQVAYSGNLNAEELEFSYRVSLTAPAVLCNAFLSKYSHQQKIILNISSGAAAYPVDGWSAYCSAKAGLQMLSEVLALEAEKRQDTTLRVFSVAPGVVDTEMQGQIRASNLQDFSRVQHFRGLKANQALSSPKEVAQKLAKLLVAPHEFSGLTHDVRNWH